MKVKIIVWNGFMGVFEMLKFEVGIKGIMDVVVAAIKSGIVFIIGGGDIVICCVKYGIENFVSYVSIGGGVFLEFLEGKLILNLFVFLFKLFMFCFIEKEIILDRD